MIARFLRFYGGDVWRSDAYPTRDRVVPWKLFHLLRAAMRPILIGEQLDASFAVQHGYVSARLDAKHRFKFDHKTRELRAIAFPVIDARPTPPTEDT